VRHQLPLDERTLLVEHGIELLVPISAKSSGELPLGLLVLGPRRSEEPYNDVDMYLLSNIADAVGALLERSAEHRRGLAECERCGRCFDAATDVCPDDGSTLAKLRGMLLLNERYHLQRRLGRGGMGTVYVAQDVILERAVAVKVIRDELTGPLDLAARFRHEARAAAGFAHPHVVRVYDFGVDRDGRPFLVMELLDGSTLRERVVSGAPLGASEVVHVMRGVCSALDAAHARGLVHRDLKPENIFLQRHAAGVIPKVLDFGLAKVLDQSRSTGATTIATSAGVLVGTLEYMAPEQVAGDEVSPAWDVWALAVIAYEMLTGTHPFRRRVGPEASTLSAEDKSFVGHTTEALTRGASAFFREALSPDRRSRPRSAGELLDRFERALRSAR
jgi:serine/threonine-protein kinase